MSSENKFGCVLLFDIGETGEKHPLYPFDHYSSIKFWLFKLSPLKWKESYIWSSSGRSNTLIISEYSH